MKKMTSYQRLKKEVKDQKSRICQLKEEIRALILMEDEILERQIRLRWLITFKEDDSIMFGESNNKLRGIELDTKNKGL